MTPQEFKAIRESLGLSQAQLAERIGVRPNSVWRWEAGMHPVSRQTAILLRTLSQPVAVSA